MRKRNDLATEDTESTEVKETKKWNTGTMEYRKDGMMEYWSNGILLFISFITHYSSIPFFH
jgi:hypothetical protein